MAISTQVLSPSHWPDLVAYFEYGGDCSGCWCMNHRLPIGLDFTGEAAKLAFEQLVLSQRVFGVLAYADSDSIPVGWLALDRKNSLPGHDCIGEAIADCVGVWSIHCVTSRQDWRQRGVERILIEAANILAGNLDAQAIEAYPEPNSREGQAFQSWNHFNGYQDVYLAQGYQAREAPSEFYAPLQRSLERESNHSS